MNAYLEALLRKKMTKAALSPTLSEMDWDTPPILPDPIILPPTQEKPVVEQRLATQTRSIETQTKFRLARFLPENKGEAFIGPIPTTHAVSDQSILPISSVSRKIADRKG